MLFSVQNEVFFSNFVRKQNVESENFPINPINVFIGDLRFFFVTGKENLGSELIGEKNKVRPGSEPPFATLFGKVTSLFQEKGKVTSCAKFCLILTVATSPQLCMCAYAIF